MSNLEHTTQSPPNHPDTPIVKPASTMELGRDLKAAIELLSQQLEIERTRLQTYAVGLPSGTIEALLHLREMVDRLSRTLTNHHGELRTMRALAETTALINSSLDTKSVLDQVMDKVILLTGAERGYIMLTNLRTGELEMRVARGIDQAQIDRGDLRISHTVVDEVFTTHRPVRTDNARSDPRYQGQESIVGYQLRSILAVPLSVRGQMIGVVYCDNRAMSGLFQDHELELLRAFADQAAVAIENARLFEATRARLAEITEMRDLLDNIFSSVVSGLITLDQDDVITSCNQAVTAITGIRVGDLVGRLLSTSLPMVSAICGDLLQRVRTTGVIEAFETTTMMADGDHYWRLVISPLRRLGDDAGGVVIVMDDLTEQKARESQLNHVQRYLPVALVERLQSEDLAMLEGDERLISVIFADVRGFTSFSERLEPEQVMEIINGYMSVATDAIDSQDGVVDKYMGDAITGLYNTQLNPQSDHAVRAVMSALQMIEAVRAINAPLPEEARLYYGIGIHTGMAVLGSVGSQERREFSALGSAMEISKLLQENANRGEIVISAATYDHVQDYFTCEALAARKTGGYANLETIYRVIDRIDRPQGLPL